MNKKIVSLFVALMMVAVAIPASAATVEELQAMIAQLTAQLSALSGTTDVTTTTTTTTGTTGVEFTRDLTVGSTGEDVTRLQLALNTEVGAGLPGTAYFGPLTKAQVIKFQLANGVPGTGYFGPLTRAALNAKLTVVADTTTTTTTVETVSNLPEGCTTAAGFSPVTGAACNAVSNLPEGCTSTVGFSPVTGAKCDATTVVVDTDTTTTLDGTDGSITVAAASYVSSGATFKKGDTQNIYDVRLTAIGGNVAVNRLDVKFSERPWLTLSKVTLKDTSGTVLAEKTLSSSADVTEITVGSDYRVRFDNLNYVVTPGTEVTLVVSATSMAASDKITTQTVTVSIPAGAVRSINGKGYTETNGSAIASKTFTFSSTGSTADLNTTVSSLTPDKRTVTTTTSVTPDVILGVYRLKALNNDATISSLSIMLNSSTGVATSTLLSNLRLVDADGTTYGAASLTAGQTFTNMNIKLVKDTWKDLTLKADIAASQSLSASTTLDASTVVGIDSNYNTLTLTTASDVTANDVIFSAGSLTLENPSVVAGNDVTDANSMVTNKNVNFIFTLKNTSNSVLYASTTRADLVATSSTGSATGATVASSTMQSLSASPSSVAGDTATNYAIQPGASRTFTLTGLVSKIAGATQYSELKITGINYSGTTVTAGTINFGLEALKYGLSM